VSVMPSMPTPPAAQAGIEQLPDDGLGLPKILQRRPDNSFAADTPAKVEPSLDDLAARIRTEHAATTAALKSTIAHAIACGELLIEAKAKVPHGQWLPWLAEHCDIPERTAQRYMYFANGRAVLEAKSATVADLSVRAAIKVLAAEEEDPEAPEIDPEAEEEEANRLADEWIAEQRLAEEAQSPEVLAEEGGPKPDSPSEPAITPSTEEETPAVCCAPVSAAVRKVITAIMAATDTVFDEALSDLAADEREPFFEELVRELAAWVSLQRSIYEDSGTAGEATPDDPANDETANEVNHATH
jgi:Protein of unknown function (DUF3102)